jgi:hypothetical protein
VANYLYLLPVPFFLLFAGGLFAALRRAEGGAGVLTVATCGAAIALAMTWPGGIVVAHTGSGPRCSRRERPWLIERSVPLQPPLAQEAR